MTLRTHQTLLTAENLRTDLDETYPDRNYGSVSVIDRYDALEAYLAFDDGALDELPLALDAYIYSQQHSAA